MNHVFPTGMKYNSRYLIDLCVLWLDKSSPLYKKSVKCFCFLVNAWNNKSATFIKPQRFVPFQILHQKDIEVVILRPLLLHGANIIPIGGQK
jgi:hypothetical protein